VQLLTGVNANEKDLKHKARAIATVIRRFNLREGMKPEDDRLPRALHRSLRDSGKVISEHEMEVLLKDYYRPHGWDKNGIPQS
jgi:aldehyde:ferredoxin oxidoreductase